MLHGQRHSRRARLAANLPLGYGTGAPQYLNTHVGVPHPTDCRYGTIRATFIHLATARDGVARTVRLLAWNAWSESAETLRFQASRP